MKIRAFHQVYEGVRGGISEYKIRYGLWSEIYSRLSQDEKESLRLIELKQQAKRALQEYDIAKMRLESLSINPNNPEGIFEK